MARRQQNRAAQDNYKPKANDKGLQRYFFRNLAKFILKWKQNTDVPSLKTFQAALRIILKFNRELDKKPREILEEV